MLKGAQAPFTLPIKTLGSFRLVLSVAQQYNSRVSGITCRCIHLYHICLANPHCRHGKRQALEHPVLGNLGERYGGRLWKVVPSVIGPSWKENNYSDIEFALSYHLQLSHWASVTPASFIEFCMACLWELLRRNFRIIGNIFAIIHGLGVEEYDIFKYTHTTNASCI